jgi:hypothetical protein
VEKIRRHIGEYLKPVKLYFDDIEELVDIFHNAGADIQIEADDYKIASPEEILSIKKPYFTDLKIRQCNISVSVDFSSNGIWLFAAEDTPVQRGLFEQTKSILRKKRRLLAPFFQSSILSGLFLGASSWFIIGSSLITMSRAWQLFIGVSMIFIGALWMWFGHLSRFRRFSIIVPFRKSDRPNFWIRNRDQIILALISAALGAIGAFVITYILQK